MTLSYFAEQFAGKVLAKVYTKSVYEGIVNRNYEGEIKKAGDRVNILSFLNSGELQDYVAGTDMAVQRILDAEDQLIVEKRKAYNISLDTLEDLFTYATNIPEYLLEEQARVLEKTIDTYVLNKFGEEVKAGSWLGMDLRVEGSGQTEASIATSATGGTVTVNANSNTYEGQIGTVEDRGDAALVFAGFNNSVLYKGFRLRSTASFVSPWYRISAVTSSTVASLTEWDEEIVGPDFEEGYSLRGLFGGDGTDFPKYGTGNASLITMSSLGWEIQAARATSVSAASIYDQFTLLAEKLDDNEVPDGERHIVLPPSGVTMLRQAAELQPSGIDEIYKGTVINGKAMRLGAFDIHSAAGTRVSTRAGQSTATTGGPSSDVVLTTGATGYLIPSNHIGFISYADKWSESRVQDAEDQFAKKYQGLYLFGAKVPRARRKFGALLFGSF
ncbi:MAG: hypothetical protein AAB706_02140 [Patescibacteria group bacterium]